MLKLYVINTVSMVQSDTKQYIIIPFDQIFHNINSKCKKVATVYTLNLYFFQSYQYSNEIFLRYSQLF